MGSKVQIELNGDGVRALLRSAEMQKAVSDIAGKVQMRAGSGYKAETHIKETRVIANVWAESQAAQKDNAQRNTLLKALGG